jgi:hypothetical protein
MNINNFTMQLSELQNRIREIIRKKMRESVLDDEGLQRVGVALPQTKEKDITENNDGGCGCGCGCGGK